MKIKSIIIILLTSSLLSGCSYIKSRFFNTSSKVNEAPKALEYNFLKPRRMSLDSNTLQRLNSSSDYQGRFKYYSANGNECRTISQDLSRTACKVNGQWVESAPILVSNLP